MDARRLHHLAAVIGLLAISGSLTGCVSIPDLADLSLGSPPFGKTGLWGARAEVVKGNEINPESAAPAGKYIVEFRDAEGSSKSAEFNIDGPLTAHAALQNAKALKHFNRIKIELVRPLPSGGWHRMPMEYDRGARRIPAECDYAIFGGDRLIVSEDTSNIFSDMVDSADDFFMSKPKSGKTKNGTFRVAG
jgi:hypothetical protein